MRHRTRTQNESSSECSEGTASNVSKAKNTSAKAVERSSEKICVKHEGFFFTSQRKAEALEGKRYNYRRSLIQGGRGGLICCIYKNFVQHHFPKKALNMEEIRYNQS